VLVVPDRRVVERVRAAPGGRVYRLELRQRAVVVLLVAQGQDAAEARVHQEVGRGLLLAAAGCAEPAVVAGVGRVAGDVSGRRDDRVGARRGRGGGRRRDRALVAV